MRFGAYGAHAFDYGLAADGALIYAHDFYDASRALVGLGRTASSHQTDNAVAGGLKLTW